jgi:hypothetical protein
MAKSSITSLLLKGAAAYLGVMLFLITLFGVGYYLIQTYNKPGTPLFKEIQPMQYVGILLCTLAVLPFIQYFFMGFLFNAGESAFSSMFE